MINKYDDVISWITEEESGVKYAIGEEGFKTTLQALKLASKLERGEVSEGAYDTGFSVEPAYGYGDKPVDDVFKAMAKVMLEEVEGE